MLELGILKTWNSTTHKAGVQLAGSLTTYLDDIAVATNIAAEAMIIGNYALVAIPGGTPRDACVVASWPAGSAGITDHGELSGLGDDDHSQYLNVARHDLVARHPLAVLDTAVCSETEADSKITTHKGDPSAHHAKTTSLTDITDHNLDNHALGTVVPHDSALNNLGDVNAPSPTDDQALAWDAATSKWIAQTLGGGGGGGAFYALANVTCIWREWDHRVSSTPRTATVSSVSGDVITLTANEAYRFGEWGASPEYMNAANVYIMIRNTTQGLNAWVKASPAANQLQVTNAADIAAWVNGNTISTYASSGAPDPSYYEELDISPLIPDGATMVFLKTQADDNGTIGWAIGLQVSNTGAAGTANNTFCQVTGLLIGAYPPTPITAARHLVVRDRASGTDTLQHSISVVAYIM